MKPRRNRAGDEPEMEPVDVFSRIQTVNETNKQVIFFPIFSPVLMMKNNWIIIYDQETFLSLKE